MSQHVTISPEEAADRLAIRELVEAYAHCADRRDAKGQMALFTPDTRFVVYMSAKDPTPSQELHSREALAVDEYSNAEDSPRNRGRDWGGWWIRSSLSARTSQ
jgi:SnoaL-like domain